MTSDKDRRNSVDVLRYEELGPDRRVKSLVSSGTRGSFLSASHPGLLVVPSPDRTGSCPPTQRISQKGEIRGLWVSPQSPPTEKKAAAGRSSGVHLVVPGALVSAQARCLQRLGGG
jgi:hypothetical protein